MTTNTADDVIRIRERLRQIESKRAEALRQTDPETATGVYLDRIGEDYGVHRNLHDTEYTYRQRLLKAIRG